MKKKLRMYLNWWGVKENGSPDYNDKHEKILEGADAHEIMMQYFDVCMHHDLAKNTRIEFVGLYDIV